MFKRFISYYRPHVPLFVFDMVSAVIVAASGLFLPIVAKNIINVYVHDDTLDRLILWSCILLGIYAVKCFFNYCVGYYGHVVGVRMQRDMRRDLFEKYERMSFSYFDNHKTGDLMSRLTSDLFDVSELAHHGPENIFLSVLMLIGAFFVLVNINLQLTLIVFAVIPFIILFTTLQRRSMLSSMKSARKEMSAINSTLENSVGGIRESKAYVAEHYEICKFNNANGRYAFFRTKAMRSIGVYHAVMTLMSDILYLVVIFTGGLFLHKGLIDAGEFTAFVLYISMVLDPINRFVTLFEQLQEGMSGFSRFHEVMSEDEEEDNGKVILDDVKGNIVFENVDFGYYRENGRKVISDLSLKIDAGCTLALVGPSGGGKSTLCNLIPRFYNVTSGRITLDGVDLCDIDLHSLRRNIGIVSQNVFLFDGTIRDNIAYGRVDATDEEIIEAAKRADIHDFVSGLEKGYDTEVGERGVKLSGGQKQRISIARVFLKNPKLLILDEATSALDNATEMQIQRSLEELAHGRTVIVVAHRLSTVKNADEIAVVDEHGIIERGTHAQLLELGGAYAKLYSYTLK